MEMDAQMPLQPPLNPGMFVRRVVIDDGMHIDLGRATCRPTGYSHATTGRATRRAGDPLDAGLQRARHDVARALALMRQPGRPRETERDTRPSR